MENRQQEEGQVSQSPSKVTRGLSLLANLPTETRSIRAYQELLFKTIHDIFNINNLYVIHRDVNSGQFVPIFFVENGTTIDHDVIKKNLDREKFDFSLVQDLIRKNIYCCVHDNELSTLKEKGIHPYLERNFDSWHGVALQDKGEAFGALVVYDCEKNISNE